MIINGTPGNDTLNGGPDNDVLYGLDGDDRLSGNEGNDTLNGGAGGDYLYGGTGNDSLVGGAGYDYLYGGAGNDTLDGGADRDEVEYSDATGPVTVNLALGTATGAGIGSDTLISVEYVTGSQYADILTGDTGSNTLRGSGGNDTLTGGAGSDYFDVWNGTADTSVDTITDFSAGVGGDRLFISTWGWTNYTTGDNPFVSGHARLTQSGANTLYEVDPDGSVGIAGFRTLAILNNVNKTHLVADNLGDFDPTPILGTAAADSLTGSIANDQIYGLAGNDTLNGLAGDDRLNGGSGNDVLNGGDGNDQLYGNEDNDSLAGGAGSDYLRGGAGDDTLNGGDDSDQLYGDEGNDSLAGGAGYDNLYGGAGDDTLNGGDDSDQLYGDEGNDSLVGGAGYDYLYGGAGNDTLDGGADSDSVNYYDATGPVTVNLALGTATGAGTGSDTLIRVENVTGSQYADILTGDTGSNTLRGYGGNDTLTGGAGSDYFDVWNGAADTSVDIITDFSAGVGGDRLSMPTWGVTNYTSGDNPFLSGHARLTQSGANTLFEVDPDGSVGAAAFRTVAILNNVNKTHLVAENLGGFDPNAMAGTAAADSLTGSIGNDQIYGLAGNDTLNGLAGDDRLNGGSGNDVLNGGDGNDQLYGNEDNDSLAGGAGSDYLRGGAGDDTLNGGDDSDQLYGDEGNDSLVGGAGYDYLYGGAGNDTLDGGADSDSVNYYDATGPVTVNLALGTATGAGTGSDTLIRVENVTGSQYADILTGDTGSNTLSGSGGNDTLTGGAGSDDFGVWNGAADTSVDIITDFSAGVGGDRLSMPTWGVTNYTSGDNPFLSGHARLTQSGANTLFEVDPDGSVGAAAFRTVAILNNVNKTHLVAENLGGFDPNAMAGTAAADSLTGSIGNDQIYGLAGNDTLNGLAGDDRLNGGSGNDVLNGGDGNDQLYGNEDNDSLAGGAGSDYLRGGAGDDTLNGGDSSDYLYGDEGNDSLAGGAGYDDLYGGAGNDTLDGGADSDSVNYYDATGPVTVNLALGTATGTGTGSDTLIRVENVTGSQYADILTGDTGSNTLRGSGGNDTLTGGAGSDDFGVWNGAADTSVDIITDFSAGVGGDRLSMPTWGVTNYTSGDNPFLSGHARLTQSGANTLFEVDPDGSVGAAAFRTVAILNNVNKTHLVAENLGGFDPNAMAGTAAADSLTGSIGNDQIYGLAGNDTLNGLAGDDRLNGGSGNDVLNGGDGNDQLYGNEDNDSLAGGAGSDYLRGGAGDDTLNGGDSSDYLYGDEGNDSLAGGAGYDDLYGGAGNDTLDGGADSDSVNYYDATGPVTVNLALGTATGTGTGSDTLISVENVTGSQYADILTGDTGSNTLRGSVGNDTLTGGAGSDSFDVWNGAADTSVDTITDFIAGPGGDRLSMPTWQWANYTSGDNPFVSGHARLTQSGANTLFEVDPDGSVGAAGFRTVAILNNVNKTHLVADNLEGFDPNAMAGTAAADSLTGSIGNDQIYGLAGNDTLNGLAGDDRLNGGSGNDVLNGGDGNDQLYGNEDNDSLAGGSGYDDLYGGVGDDTLAGGAGYDDLYGGAGNDTLDGGADSDSVNYYDATGPVTVNLALGTATGAGIGSDTLISVENVTGSQYADILTGDTGSNSLRGSGGNDTLTGGAGSDSFDVWNGTADTSVDTITDFIAGPGGDRLSMPTGAWTNYTYGDNPFVSGHARLTQSGANTLFEVDPDGSVGAAGFRTVAILNNVTKSNLVADNVGGFDPNVIRGTAAADSLAGGVGNDQIYGLAGNDTLNGLAGDDRLYGGSGNDVLDGGDGNDPLYGNEDNDSMAGGAGYDTLTGGAGNDTLTGGVGSDYFNVWNGTADTTVDTITDFLAGPGGDRLSMPTGAWTNYTYGDNPFVSGHSRLTQSGANTLFEVDPDGSVGIAGFRTLAILNNVTRSLLVAENVGGFDPTPIFGTAVAESLVGSMDNDEIYGLAGNDTLSGLAGDDHLSGGADNDMLNGGAGSDDLRGDTGDDTLNGGDGDDELDGDEGNDSLVGGAGYDYLSGGAGDDTLNGGDGDDELAGDEGNDSLAGGAGYDYLYGGAGNDTLDGGADLDEVEYYDATGPVTVNLALGTATGAGIGSDTLISIENITGSHYADILTGDTGSNTLSGYGGNDTLTGGTGSDNFVVFWNGAADTSVNTITDFSAGVGGDRLSTPAWWWWLLTNYTSGDNPFVSGHARLTQSGANTLVEVDPDGSVGAAVFRTVVILNNVTKSHLVAENLGGFDPNPVLGTAAAESLAGGAGNNEIYGFAGNDTLSGLAGDDRLYGGSGNDMLNGGDGNDQLYGNEDNDSMAGGAGYDTLTGGAGNDTLTGGVDIDYFSVWNGAADTSVDTITDFTAGLGGDRLSTPTTGLTNYTSGDNPFASGHVRLTQSAANTLFEVDPDGSVGAGVFRTLAILNHVTRSLLVADNLGGFDPNPISGTAAADSLSGGAGNDEIYGFAGNDTLNGLAGDDRLYGGTGNDRLNGGAGFDTLIGGAGNDTLDGGAITDWIGGNDYNRASYDASTAGVTVNLGAGAGIGNGTANDGLGGTDTLININQITGSRYADSITGSSGASVFEQFEGGLGDDTMNGGVITDTLNQENNNRVSYQNASGAVSVDLAAGTASGAAGNDTLINFSQIRGSGYNDTLFGSDSTLTERFEGLAGNDSIDGRGGFDNVAYDRSTSAVNVNLVTGTASDGFGYTDTLSHIEGIRGSAYNDVLTGGLAANGTSVSDGLSERFIGNAGNDTIDGGQGYDRVDYTTSPNGVNVTLNDTLDGSASDGFGGTDTLRHIEGVFGSAYNDTLTGSDSAPFESFEGRAGNDQINGKGGIDRIDYYSSTAGATVNLATGTASDGYGGTDTLANIENVRGSRDFNDSLTGSTANNKLEGLGGNDTLDGGAGSDTLVGGDGSDTYVVRDSGDVVSETNAVLATGGSDTVYSTLAAYTLTNNVENGRILSTTAANLTGNTLNNVLYAGAGNNVLNGGSGIDTVSYAYGLAGTTGATVSLAVGTAQATGGSGSDTLTSIENLIGSAYADRLTGNTGANSLGGGAGSDTLDGGAGSDTLAGGDGSDTYVVRDGGDVVSETNAVLATGGTDTVYSDLSVYTLTANVENGRILSTTVANLTGNTLNNVLYAGAGSNVLDGGSGIDTVSYAYGLAGTSGVTVSLAVGTAQATGGSGSDTLTSIENLIGSAYADRLTGNTGANSLGGGAGNDTFDGGAGSDTLAGGDGSDTYVVRDGGDVVSETNAVLASGGSDTVYSSLAAYTLTANVENGRILATVAANLTGNTLNNVLYAGAGNNGLDGGTGIDTVSYAYGLAGTTGVTVSLAVDTAQATGGSGSDTLTSIENLIGSAYADQLTGNTGANSLGGGAGNDLLTGGIGRDMLTGGSGSDTFDFNALSEMGLTNTTWDVINDFAPGLDRIDLSTLDANEGLAGNQAFSAPVVGGAFSGAFATAGDLYFDNVAHVLYGNTDADAAAEFALQLVGVSTLTVADLFL